MDSPDRLRFLIDTLIAALDDAVDGDALAKRAYLSRFHFDRLIARGLGEAPATFRRRLLLERAAWQLLQGADVTRTAFDNGYGSSEAFTHAFVRAYGVAPSRFAAENLSYRLAAPNGIHFHAPAGLHIPGQSRRQTMDLNDRLLEHDRWVTQGLLDCAAQLPDAQLDQEIFPNNVVDRIDGPETSIRALLDHHVFAKEVWNAAIGGTKFPEPAQDKSVTHMRNRHYSASKRFGELVRNVRERGEWDDAFVDALCDPPQSFTYGSVVAHVLVHAAHRRGLIAAGLTQLGARDVPSTCAIEWEMKVTGN
jgi:AraC family transcriptional regulator